MKTNRPDGGPAFPSENDDKYYHGITVRDYFAGASIGPLMASDGFEKRLMKDDTFKLDDLPKFAAELAYEIADAMLKEREREA